MNKDTITLQNMAVTPETKESPAQRRHRVLESKRLRKMLANKIPGESKAARRIRRLAVK